ncbi:MAG: hypothetical protein ACJAT2_002851 [Bacteriovoracaceae bacterium]|jgi:hypothetical protein
MRVLCFIIGIVLCSHSYANQELKDAITGFNNLAKHGTDPLLPCREGKLPPRQVYYEEGADASELHKRVDLGFKKGFKTQEYEGDRISVLTKEEADKLFKAFSEVDYMKFDYLHGGCEIRAHEYALIAKANGIEMGKAMTMYGDRIDRGGLYPKEWTKKEEAGESIPAAEGFVGWRYHVAPYVLVKEKGVVRPYVLDVGIAEKTKTLNEWNSSLISLKEKKTRTFVKQRGYLHPDDKTPRVPEKSYISTEINKQKLIREMGYFEFEYWDNKGLLSY